MTTPASSLTTPTLTFTLASTNPTALPLSLIESGATTQPTVAASTTFAAGATPTFLSGAPGLPNAAALVPSNYPTLDVTPPTDSAEVQQWIQDVANSGITIPDIPVNLPGGCPANPGAVANQTACWWSCGACTAPDDITDCPTQLTWGLTYDDGPALYTGNLLQYLDQQNLHATFFVVGSRAISYPALLQEEFMAGHQIGVHTWSHPDMTTLTNDQVIAELGWTKKVIKDVLGVTPTYWRPPYGDVDNRVRAIAKAMNLTTSMWTSISEYSAFDTGDFEIAGGTTTSQQVLNNWDSIMGNVSSLDHGFIVLEHDLFQQTVDLAVDYILPDALARKPALTIQPIILCQKEPMENAYIETRSNTTSSVSGSSTQSGSGTGTAKASGTTGASAADSSNAASGAFSVSGSFAAMGLALAAALF